MNKLTLIVCFLSTFIGCTNKSRQENISLSLDKPHLIEWEKKLFLRPALNDTLSYFMESIGAIPNPLDAHKFNNIIFCPGFHPHKPSDTLIIYLTQLIPYEIDELQEKSLFLKGGCEINGEYVAVYYEYFTDLSNIVNEDILNLEYIENAIANIPADTTSHIWHYNAHEWTYKLAGDSLEVWRKLDFTYKGLKHVLW